MFIGYGLVVVRDFSVESKCWVSMVQRWLPWYDSHDVVDMGLTVGYDLMLIS